MGIVNALATSLSLLMASMLAPIAFIDSVMAESGEEDASGDGDARVLPPAPSEADFVPVSYHRNGNGQQLIKGMEGMESAAILWHRDADDDSDEGYVVTYSAQPPSEEEMDGSVISGWLGFSGDTDTGFAINTRVVENGRVTYSYTGKCPTSSGQVTLYHTDVPDDKSVDNELPEIIMSRLENSISVANPAVATRVAPHYAGVHLDTGSMVASIVHIPVTLAEEAPLDPIVEYDINGDAPLHGKVDVLLLEVMVMTWGDRIAIGPDFINGVSIDTDDEDRVVRTYSRAAIPGKTFIIIQDVHFTDGEYPEDFIPGEPLSVIDVVFSDVGSVFTAAHEALKSFDFDSITYDGNINRVINGDPEENPPEGGEEESVLVWDVYLELFVSESIETPFLWLVATLTMGTGLIGLLVKIGAWPVTLTIVGTYIYFGGDITMNPNAKRFARIGYTKEMKLVITSVPPIGNGQDPYAYKKEYRIIVGYCYIHRFTNGPAVETEYEVLRPYGWDTLHIWETSNNPSIMIPAEKLLDYYNEVIFTVKFYRYFGADLEMKMKSEYCDTPFCGSENWFYHSRGGQRVKEALDYTAEGPKFESLNEFEYSVYYSPFGVDLKDSHYKGEYDDTTHAHRFLADYNRESVGGDFRDNFLHKGIIYESDLFWSISNAVTLHFIVDYEIMMDDGDLLDMLPNSEKNWTVHSPPDSVDEVLEELDCDSYSWAVRPPPSSIDEVLKELGYDDNWAITYPLLSSNDGVPADNIAIIGPPALLEEALEMRGYDDTWTIRSPPDSVGDVLEELGYDDNWAIAYPLPSEDDEILPDNIAIAMPPSLWRASDEVGYSDSWTIYPQYFTDNQTFSLSGSARTESGNVVSHTVEKEVTVYFDPDPNNEE